MSVNFDTPTTDNGHMDTTEKPKQKRQKRTGFDHEFLAVQAARGVALCDQEIARLEAEIAERQADLRGVKATRKKWEEGRA